MNLDEIRTRVAKIEGMNDDEGQHVEEDSLMLDFIKFVSTSRSKKLAEMAKEILRVSEMDFSRWYA
jgi:hypothetical protein